MSVISPGSTIGILGGGQLGRMIALEANAMGYRVIGLDPDGEGPLAQVADEMVCAPFNDAAAAKKLAAQSDVVTFEFENIPAEIAQTIEAIKPVRPASSVLRTIQSRLIQKQFLDQHKIPQTKYLAIESEKDLVNATKFPMPTILKSCRLGYDGKGQVRLQEAEDLKPAWESLKRAPAVLEAFVSFDKEISVILARGVDGAIQAFPIAENVHRNGILHTTRAPAKVSAKVATTAVKLASDIASAINHVGVMAVEMFLKGDQILVNEIAPRVHNSGHYTFGACATSQFAQHIRAVCGLPLGDPSLLRPVVMVNLLGDLWQKGEPNWELVRSNPKMQLHLYGKKEARVGRKMGHLLIFDSDTDWGLARSESILLELTNKPS